MYFTTIVIVSALFLVPNAKAHSPIDSGNNDSLETATLVPEPTKSWAVYAELHEGGEAQYYKFEIQAGERIYIMLFKSTSTEMTEFMPGFVLMGPGLNASGEIPAFVEVAENVETVVVNGLMSSQASYEPFSPSAFYELAQLDIGAPVSGIYYVAVFEPDRGGNYGLAIGERESFTASEWLLMPLSLLSVYQWEGQNILAILAPLIATVIIGLSIMIWRYRKGMTLDPPAWISSLAGLLFLGGGLTILAQMIFALTQAPLNASIGVTIIFITIPVTLGLWTIRTAMKRNGDWTTKARIYMLIIGIVALVMWSGYIIGPVLAMVSSIFPIKLPFVTKRTTEA